MLSRIILLLQKMSILQKRSLDQMSLPWKDRWLAVHQSPSLRTISKSQESWSPPNILSHYASMAWKSIILHSWLQSPRIWCIELHDMSNVPSQASTTNVCNKCSKSTPWENYKLLQFIVTMNFAPSWIL
jgi:hypothetical protein